MEQFQCEKWSWLPCYLPAYAPPSTALAHNFTPSFSSHSGKVLYTFNVAFCAIHFSFQNFISFFTLMRKGGVPFLVMCVCLYLYVCMPALRTDIQCRFKLFKTFDLCLVFSSSDRKLQKKTNKMKIIISHFSMECTERDFQSKGNRWKNRDNHFRSKMQKTLVLKELTNTKRVEN